MTVIFRKIAFFHFRIKSVRKFVLGKVLKILQNLKH